MDIPNLSDFTLWNWLALIAFVLSAISVTNAILSLKTRFRDWWAVRTKAMFDKRVEMYKKRVRDFAAYTNNPSIFIADVVKFTADVIGLFAILIIFEALIVGVLYLFEPQSARLMFNIIFVLDGVVGVLVIFGFAVDWSVKLLDYKKQGNMMMKIIELVKEGKEKGYVEDDKALLDEIFEPERRQHLNNRINEDDMSMAELYERRNQTSLPAGEKSD